MSPSQMTLCHLSRLLDNLLSLEGLNRLFKGKTALIISILELDPADPAARGTRQASHDGSSIHNDRVIRASLNNVFDPKKPFSKP